MTKHRLLLPVLAALGLAGCVAYPAPGYGPPPRAVYAGPPSAYYAPPYHHRRWHHAPRCDRWGRCWGG